MKRGQVTVFVIIGLVLVVAIGLVFMYKDKIITTQEKLGEGVALSESEQEVQVIVENCLEETAKEAIILLGYQGLYIELPEQKRSFGIY